MTERLDDDMPEKIWVVPSDEKSGEYDVNRFCECLDCQLCRTSQQYVHTDLYTAVCAERDKWKSAYEMVVKEKEDAMIGREDYRRERNTLRELCDGMKADMNKAKRMIGGFTYDAQSPAQKEVSVNQAWHVLDDAVSQYEKHKGVG